MTQAPILDTHAWIWWVDHDRRLGRAVLRRLDDLPPADRPYVCDISLWEVAMLVERRRLSFGVSLEEWLAAAAHPLSVQLIDIDSQIAAEVARLPETFQRDPADRLIVATSRVRRTPLLTHDRRIRRSRLVTLWRPASDARPSHA